MPELGIRQNSVRANINRFPVKAMATGLLLYVEQGKLPGSALYHILRNELRQAVGAATPEVRDTLSRIIIFMREYLPADAWGSPENVQIWQDHRGLEGLLERAPKEEVE